MRGSGQLPPAAVGLPESYGRNGDDADQDCGYKGLGSPGMSATRCRYSTARHITSTRRPGSFFMTSSVVAREPRPATAGPTLTGRWSTPTAGTVLSSTLHDKPPRLGRWQKPREQYERRCA